MWTRRSRLARQHSRSLAVQSHLQKGANTSPPLILGTAEIRTVIPTFRIGRTQIKRCGSARRSGIAARNPTHAASGPQKPPRAFSPTTPPEPWTGLCAEVLPRVCTSWLLLCLPPSLPGSARGVFLPTEPPVRQECGLQRRVQPLFKRGFVFRSSALRPGAQLPSLLRLRRRTHV